MRSSHFVYLIRLYEASLLIIKIFNTIIRENKYTFYNCGNVELSRSVIGFARIMEVSLKSSGSVGERPTRLTHPEYINEHACLENQISWKGPLNS